MDKFIYLECKWNNCGSNIQINIKELDYAKFFMHIKMHIQYLNRCEEKFCCQWDSCFYNTIDITYDEMIIHLLRHSYVQLLITRSQNLIDKYSLNKCLIETHEKNFYLDSLELFRCEWINCEQTFKCPFAFHKHVCSHCIGSQCQWNGCTYESSTKLLQHMKTHTNEKRYCCSTCLNLFSDQTKFSNHLERQLPFNHFRCNLCLKYFPTNRLLRIHINNHVNSVKCPYCDFTFISERSAKRHVIYRHSNERYFECSQCNKKYKDFYDYKRHYKIHENSKNLFENPICEQILGTIDPLDSNLNTEIGGKLKSDDPRLTNNLYECHECNAKFKKGSYLSVHLLKKHDIKKPDGFSKFQYKLSDNGFYRLNLVRYEKEELRTFSFI